LLPYFVLFYDLSYILNNGCERCVDRSFIFESAQAEQVIISKWLYLSLITIFSYNNLSTIYYITAQILSKDIKIHVKII